MFLPGSETPLKHPEDISYCDNRGCPFMDCARHLEQLKSCQGNCVISIANLCGHCRKYVRWCLEAVNENPDE